MGFWQEFINSHTDSTFKYHNFLCFGGFGELIIDNFLYAFDQCFEVLTKINLYKLMCPLIREGKRFFTILL